MANDNTQIHVVKGTNRANGEVDFRVRNDDATFIKKVGHSLAVDAGTKVFGARIDASGNIVGATNQTGEEPMFFLVDTSNADMLAKIDGGAAHVPGTSITPGKEYWITATGTLTDVPITGQNPVCKGMHTDWIFFFRRGTGLGTAIAVPTTFKAARIRVLTSANAGNTQLYDIQFRQAAGLIEDHSGDTSFTDSLRVGFEPARAFDNAGVADPTAWVSAENPTFPVYVGTIFAIPHEINQLSLTAHATGETPSNRPLTWELQGSEDTTDGADGTWHTLLVHTEDTFAVAGEHVIEVTPSVPPTEPEATHWRLRIYDNALTVDSPHTHIDEIEFRTTAGVAQVMPSGTAFASSKWTDASRYGPEKAFDGSLMTATGQEDRYWSSGNTAPFPHDIGVVFATAQSVAELMIKGPNRGAAASRVEPKDFDLQYSTDNGTTWKTQREYRGLAWADAETKLLPAMPGYTHWRLNVLNNVGGAGTPTTNIDEVEFRVATGVSEAMPFATAFASTTYPPSNYYNAPFAFNTSQSTSTTPVTGDYDKYWASGQNIDPPHTLGCVFAGPREVAELMVRAVSFYVTQDAAPKDFDLEASNDGTNWDTIKEYRNLSWAAGEEKVFSTAPDPALIAFTHFRLNVFRTARDISPSVLIDELEFREQAGVSETMPSGTVFANGFYDEGASSVYWRPQNVFNQTASVSSPASGNQWHSPGGNSANDPARPHQIGLVFATARTVAEIWLRASVNAVDNRYELMPRDFDLEGSNDGSTWQVIKQFRGETWTVGQSRILSVDGSSSVPPSVTYKAARMVITDNYGANYTYVPELEFRAVSGVIEDHSVDTPFASSEFTGSPGQYAAAKAFDNSEPDIWASLAGQALPQYVGLIFATPSDIQQIALRTSTADPTALPKAFRIEVSDDTTDGTDGTWRTIATHSDVNNAQGVYLFDAPTVYKGARINVTANNGDTYVQIGEVQFRTTIGGAVDHSTDTPFQSSLYDDDAAYDASKLYDGVAGTVWASKQSEAFPQFAGLVFATPIENIDEVLISLADGGTPANLPTAFDVQISTDTTNGLDGTWTVLKSFIIASPANGDELFQVAGPGTVGPYYYLQVEIIDWFNSGDGRTAISEYELYDENDVNIASSATFTASSILAGTSLAHLTDGAVAAPPPDPRTLWSSDTAASHWVQGRFDPPRRISKYALGVMDYINGNAAAPDQAGDIFPKEWKFWGSTSPTGLAGSWDLIEHVVLSAYPTAGLLERVTASLSTVEVDIGGYTDATPVPGDGSVTVNGTDSLTFNIANQTNGANAVVAASTNMVTLADGEIWEIAADWECAEAFYQEATVRWLAMGFIRDNVIYPSAQWDYRNPFRENSNISFGIWFGPIMHPIFAINGVGVSGIPTTEWEVNWPDNITAARNVRMRIAPDGVADSRYLVYANGAASADEHVVAGFRPTGQYRAVLWASDYNDAKVINVTNLEVRRL